MLELLSCQKIITCNIPLLYKFQINLSEIKFKTILSWSFIGFFGLGEVKEGLKNIAHLSYTTRLQAYHNARAFSHLGCSLTRRSEHRATNKASPTRDP